MSVHVAPVRVASGTFADDWRAVKVVWNRELIRFSRNKPRIVTSLAQPVLFLFVLGTGLAHLIPGATGFDFRTFMFPGVISMTILFTAIFSAVSIVWDREFGFLREMLVAPSRRWAIMVGKAAGGATVATMQGVIILALAGVVHVPYSPVLLLTLLVEMALVAFMLTAFGLALASRIKQVESFQVVMQLFVLPMFFLAGAIFPLTRTAPVAGDAHQDRSARVRGRPDASRRLRTHPDPSGGRCRTERGGDLGWLAASERLGAGGRRGCRTRASGDRDRPVLEDGLRWS